MPLISILIPVYNWNISSLIKILADEIISKNFLNNIELIVLDDGTQDKRLSKLNSDCLSSFNKRLNCRYEELPFNVGRVAVRNSLIKKANGDYLLFLDCDVLPDKDNFLSTYLEHARLNTYDVICGGRSYQKISHPIKEDFSFYFYLSQKTEVKLAKERNKEAWRYIFTSNLMIRKSLMDREPFSDKFVGYGYEDIEWGIRVSEFSNILHIDNTATHLGLIKKEEVFSKMRQASINHYLLYKKHYVFIKKTKLYSFLKVLLKFSHHFQQSVLHVLEFFSFKKLPNFLTYYVYQLSKVAHLAKLINQDKLKLQC